MGLTLSSYWWNARELDIAHSQTEQERWKDGGTRAKKILFSGLVN